MRRQMLAVFLALILMTAARSDGDEKRHVSFFSEDGDIAMALQTGKPAADLLANYGPPDRREPFVWQNHRGELWSYVRTTITTNSAKRPASLACVRQFYVNQGKSEVHGTWRSGFCYPPYDPKVLDTL